MGTNMDTRYVQTQTRDTDSRHGRGHVTQTRAGTRDTDTGHRRGHVTRTQTRTRTHDTDIGHGHWTQTYVHGTQDTDMFIKHGHGRTWIQTQTRHRYEWTRDTTKYRKRIWTRTLTWTYTNLNQLPDQINP